LPLVERIFDRLTGIYGAAFTNKFATGRPDPETGGDAGMENAKRVWSEELGGFDHRQGYLAIAGALKNLDPKFPPSALEFRDSCRDCVRRIRDDHVALPHKPTPEEQARTEKAAAMAKDAMKKAKERDPLDWAKRPRSKLAFNEVLKLANAKDSRFVEILAELVKQGASDGHRLLTAWNGQEWVKAT
jgi:hypothetical protein